MDGCDCRGNGPGEEPQAQGEDRGADHEAEKFVFGTQGEALAVVGDDEFVVVDAGEHAEHAAEAKAEEGETGVGGGHAEGLVDWWEGLGEHVDEGERDGADDGYQEDNGFGEEEVDGAKEGHGEEGAEVRDTVWVEALHHHLGLLAEGLAQAADFLVEEEGRSRFTDAEQETRDKAGDDGGYVEHPSPERSQYCLESVLGTYQFKA